jgi:hypothetical protein
MGDLLDLMSESIRHWFDGHGSTCGWILILVLHNYILQFNVRRVLGMRRGDGIWMMPPRESQMEKAAGGRPWWKWALYTLWHPKRPRQMRARPKSIPPQDPPVDSSEAITPTNPL